MNNEATSLFLPNLNAVDPGASYQYDSESIRPLHDNHLKPQLRFVFASLACDVLIRNVCRIKYLVVHHSHLFVH